MPVKPTPQEETYFAMQERERRRRDEAERERRRQQEQKDLHWMHCPKCGSRLAEIGFQEQRVDRCEACGGVWLDAGELEALARKEAGVLPGLARLFRG